MREPRLPGCQRTRQEVRGRLGSEWLCALVAPDRDPLLFISRMTIVEVISAFARRHATC